MSEEPFSATNKAFSKAMILEIDQPVEDSPLQFPAVIRNLLGGLAILEVTNPPTIMDWESLKGREGCLHLHTETGEVADVHGFVNWASYSVHGLDLGILNLGLALTDPDPSLQKLLTECIQHPDKDLKSFWDRWDQAQENKSPLWYGGIVLVASHVLRYWKSLRASC
jgi:hypothetical protein